MDNKFLERTSETVNQIFPLLEQKRWLVFRDKGPDPNEQATAQCLVGTGPAKLLANWQCNSGNLREKTSAENAYAKY